MIRARYYTAELFLTRVDVVTFTLNGPAFGDILSCTSIDPSLPYKLSKRVEYVNSTWKYVRGLVCKNLVAITHVDFFQRHSVDIRHRMLGAQSNFVVI